MEEKRNAYMLLIGNPERKRPLGRLRRRWWDNINKDIGEIGWGAVDWIGLALGREQSMVLVNAVMNLRLP
jgi:hypothetical protein